jgi:hypothetical protein
MLSTILERKAEGEVSMKRIIGSLLVLGCVLILVGLYIRTLDFGSCPAIPTAVNVTFANSTCYHTFDGTGIYITPTGNIVAFIGVVVLVLTLVMFLRPRSSSWYKHGMWERYIGKKSRSEK